MQLYCVNIKTSGVNLFYVHFITDKQYKEHDNVVWYLRGMMKTASLNHINHSSGNLKFVNITDGYLTYLNLQLPYKIRKMAVEANHVVDLVT